MSFIEKIILLELVFSLSAPPADKTQLSFNSTLQLLHDNLSDLQKLLKYIIGTAIVSFKKFHSFHLQLYFLII